MEIPSSYYDRATGQGDDLKRQLGLIMADGHNERTYDELCHAFTTIDADPDNPGNILLIYSRVSVNARWDGGRTWNREHVWPKTLQPGRTYQDRGNLSDAFAIFPCDPLINYRRSSNPFSLISSQGVWHPGPSAGVVARALFYSDTRYAGVLPGLRTGIVGDVRTLIKWHFTNPPDELERRRNDAVFRYQHNRNAYIDHPEFVGSVYGVPASEPSTAPARPAGRHHGLTAKAPCDPKPPGMASPMSPALIRTRGQTGPPTRERPLPGSGAGGWGS